MAESDDKEREDLREGNEGRYRMWAVENFKLISFEALISLFGGPEAHKIKEEAEEMAKLTAVDRKTYQREWVRKDRLKKKLEKEAAPATEEA